MRVLHLLKSTTYSGAENVVISIMKHSAGIEMAYVSPDGPIREVVEENYLTFLPIKKASIKEIKRVVRIWKPDVIHAHDFGMSTLAAMGIADIPVVAHLHCNPTWARKPTPKTILFLLASYRMKRIITVSESVEKEFFLSSVFSKKVTVLPNVVDGEEIRRKAQESISDAIDSVDLVFLGRMFAPKNPLMFCDIVRQVKEKIPSVSAMMIGDGELYEDVKAYIEDNELTNTIRLVGFQKNPYPYLNKGKILVMPSIYEGFGLAAVEAMCLGKPVICSNVGGLKCIIDGNNGTVCTRINEFVVKIQDLLSDRMKYAQFSRCAYNRSKEYCGYDRYIDLLTQIYYGGQI